MDSSANATESQGVQAGISHSDGRAALPTAAVPGYNALQLALHSFGSGCALAVKDSPTLRNHEAAFDLSITLDPP
jgi:hypothetical protein